jgi:hypothetical protein
MRAVAGYLLLASAAAAAPPSSLTDPTRYLRDETYQPTPRRLLEWEEGQIAQTGNVWVDLGSLEGGEYDAIERGVVNLPLAPRFALHGELRNDRDPESRVTRAVVDLLVNVAPGLWLGPAGVPAAHKQDYGVGGSLLWVDSSRRRYVLARLVADQFLYNRTTLDGGTRDSPVLHAQVEARWERGPWSMFGWIDATTDSSTSFPAAPLVTFSETSRREASLHGRYAQSGLELDARLDFLRTVDGRIELGAASSLRQTLVTLRLEALLPPIAAVGWRPRLALYGRSSDAAGQEAGTPYEVTRREPGARIAAEREAGVALWEIGYLISVPVLRQTGGAAAGTSAPYEDAVYGSCDLSFGKLHLRALLSWEPRELRFGGGNGNVLFQF